MTANTIKIGRVAPSMVVDMPADRFDDVAAHKLRWVHEQSTPVDGPPWMELRCSTRTRPIMARWCGCHWNMGPTYSLDLVGHGPVVQIDLPFAPASKKNSRVWTTNGHLMPGKRAQRNAETIREYAGIALSRAMGRTTGYPWRVGGKQGDVVLELTHHAVVDMVTVTAMGSTRPPSTENAARDLHGMIELVADALESIWYENDRQVAGVLMRRV